MSKKEKTNHERLKEAWENAPDGVKARVIKCFGYTWQNIDNMLKNGRKDEDTLLSLLQAIKQASADVVKEAYEKNNVVQSV